MHYAILLVCEKPTDEAIKELMAPHGNGKEWDFYMVGGRYTGRFDGYDPETDPKNIETCSLCHGTGTRTDMSVKNGCNGCAGRGKSVKWPTQWVRHNGDIIPISNLTQEQANNFYAYCTDYGWHGGEEYLPWRDSPHDSFVRREKPPLEWLKQRGNYAVVIDCHN